MEQTGAVLAAAGLSSRMGEWKPLLPFGESTISRHIVGMLKELKIKPIVVVTGYRAGELENHLSDTGVRFVRNERFQENQMFDSVCLGVQEILGECRRILIMPMDIPAISLETLFQVIQAEGEVVRPWYGGAAGHPIIADSKLAARLCRYQGEGGLRAAIDHSGAAVTELTVGDEAVCRDVDTKEEYDALLEWSRRKKKKKVGTIYLIRHGRVGFPDGRKRCIGRTDLELDDAGKRQAGALKRYFQALRPGITAVYTSPLSRARETAQILSGQRLPVIIREGLSEIDMGEWENRPLDELHKTLEQEPEQGEKREAALRRIKKELSQIIEEAAGDVAVVAHAGINCCLLADSLGTPLETSRALNQPYGGISRIQVKSDGTFQVQDLGRMPGCAPSAEECSEIWERCKTPEPVRQHCRAVAKKARQMGEELFQAGISVDLELIEGAALLHDVARAEEHHAEAGAALMIREGYPEAAAIIRQHHHLESERIDEAAVVFLADKLVLGVQPVSLEERFRHSALKCTHSLDAWKAHEERRLQAFRVQRMIQDTVNQLQRLQAYEIASSVNW